MSSSAFGTVIIQRHYDVHSNAEHIEVIQADDVVQIAADLAAEQGIGHGGGRFNITDDVAYDLGDYINFPTVDRYADTFIGTKVKS